MKLEAKILLVFVSAAMLFAARGADALPGNGNFNAVNASFSENGILQSISIGEAVFATGGGNLWEAEFLTDPGASTPEMLSVSASNATSFAKRESDSEIVLSWRGIPLGGEADALDATVTIAKNADGSQTWSLRFANRSPRCKLKRTCFPMLRRVTRDGEGDALLPWKDYGARLFRRRTAQPNALPAHYLGYAPPVAAFFLGETGLYIAAEDPQARQKCLVESGEQNVHFDTLVELGADGPGYNVTLAPLKGDWWEAARRYRKFALGQKWARLGPIKDNPSYPKPLCEIPLWINIHGHSDMASNVLARAKSLFPGFATGIHWHLWQQSGHDVNYPEYFPAQPRVKETIDFCHSIGQEPMPYTNGRLWTATTMGYLLAEPWAVMKTDGSRVVETYAKSNPPLAVMCPWTATWQRVVQTFTGRILDELGAKSLFIDQVGAARAYPCYDPSHGHPVGGGAWWREGYVRMLEPIRRAYNERGAFLTTEGAGEAYLDLFDGFLQVVERKPEDVPFWSAVYSGYTTYFCSSENVDDDSQSFRIQQSREMLWGHPLGWFDPGILDKPQKVEILRRLCTFRQANLDALAYGNLLDELRPVSPLPEIEYTWKPRAHWSKSVNRGTCPAVVGNWWRTADGETVLLAANLTDHPQALECKVWDDGRHAGKTAAVSLEAHELKRIGIRQINNQTFQLPKSTQRRQS